MKNIGKIVVQIIATKFESDISEISHEDNLINDLFCDSLDFVEIMMSLEDEFNIEISDDESDKIVTVEDFINLVRDKKVAEFQNEWNSRPEDFTKFKKTHGIKDLNSFDPINREISHIPDLHHAVNPKVVLNYGTDEEMEIIPQSLSLPSTGFGEKLTEKDFRSVVRTYRPKDQVEYSGKLDLKVKFEDINKEFIQKIARTIAIDPEYILDMKGVVLNLGYYDILIIKGDFTPEEALSISELMLKKFPDNKCIILDRDMDLSTIDSIEAIKVFKSFLEPIIPVKYDKYPGFLTNIGFSEEDEEVIDKINDDLKECTYGGRSFGVFSETHYGKVLRSVTLEFNKNIEKDHRTVIKHAGKTRYIFKNIKDAVYFFIGSGFMLSDYEIICQFS